jgi:glycosyltransferase involved in cell wall biosynthesis
MDVRTLPVSPEKTKYYIDQKILRLNLRYATERFDGITYITDEMRRFCISEYALPHHLSTIWTSGVNVDLFIPKFLRDDNRVFRLLYHGTISKNRGLDNVIRALSLLKNIDIHMEFLGKGDGLDELQSLAKKQGVFDKVSFLSPVDYRKVPDSINRVHAGILPFPEWSAWNTSSPIKLFEYLSCSKPVIVTNIPAHRSAIGNRDFAFWANDNSPEALARAISQANGERPTFEALGRDARQFVTEQYTWEQQAKNLHDFFVQILAK